MRSAGWKSLAGCGGIWTPAFGKVGASSSHSQPSAVSCPPTVASCPPCPALPATHTPKAPPQPAGSHQGLPGGSSSLPTMFPSPSGHRAQLRAWSCCLGLSGAPRFGLEWYGSLASHARLFDICCFYS